MGQADSCTDGIQWTIKSPEGAGPVWLIWENKGRKLALNLGTKREARIALSDWMASTGNGEEEQVDSRGSGLGGPQADPWGDW